MVKLVSVATPSGAAPDWRKGSSTALINRFVNMGCGPEPPENRQAEPHCGYAGPFRGYREAEALPQPPSSRPGGFSLSRMNERAQRKSRQASHAQSLFAPFCD
jgi:hypothetical protein